MADVSKHATEAPVCARTHCGKPATCAVGIALYPPRSVMKFYRTGQWLTRMILGMTVCDEHFPTNPFELLPRDRLAPIAKVCEQSSGTAVDIEGTKAVKVALDDPDYLMLLRQGKEQPHGT
jgi:hypothetical protein